MAKIIIRNGIDNELTTNVAPGTTVSQVAANAGFQAALNFSGSDTFKVNGYTAGGGYVLQEGDLVSFEKAACTKA